MSMCGFDCNQCKAFAPNILKNDEREQLSVMWKKYYDLDFKADEMYCDGCRSDKPDAKRISDNCLVRSCVIEKGLEHCGECEDYPCEDYTHGLCMEEAKQKFGEHFSADEYTKYLAAYDNKTRLSEHKNKVNTNTKIIAQAIEIVKKNTVQDGTFQGEMCVLSLIDEEGFPTASVVTPSKSDGINWVTFCTFLDNNRARRSIANKRASVCFSSDEYCINLVGEIEVITSADVKQEMWYDTLSLHVSGPEDPNYCVLKFTTKRYKIFIKGQGHYN